MKKNGLIWLLFLPLLYICFSCCQHNDLVSNTIVRKTTKSNDQYLVTEQDIKELLSNQCSISLIRSFPDGEEPALYVVKTDSGFFIISADKRATPFVAFSDSGHIDNALPELEEFILQEFAAPIRVIQASADIEPAMYENLIFWDNVYRSGPANNNTLQNNHLPLSIGPLLETQWGQSDHYANDHYWNQYCPWADSTCTGAKSPVGCVAVAGGQFGYYMRDMDGVAIRIPTEASCYGYVGNYSRTFSNHTSISWIDEMPLNYSNTTAEMEHARIFLAYIGECVNMNYGGTSSTASTSSLTMLFDTWGIDCDYVQFDDSLALAQLSSSIPVITRASNTSQGGGAHSWIIDGFLERIQLIQNDESIRVNTDLNNAAGEVIFFLYDQYHMNWGNDGAYDGWFSTANWDVAGYSFGANKHMIRVNL